MTDASIEQEIQAEGKTAERVTPARPVDTELDHFANVRKLL